MCKKVDDKILNICKEFILNVYLQNTLEIIEIMFFNIFNLHE